MRTCKTGWTKSREGCICADEAEKQRWKDVEQFKVNKDGDGNVLIGSTCKMERWKVNFEEGMHEKNVERRL